MQCSQTGCEGVAVAHFFWPGSEPKPVCAPHIATVRGVAHAMGFSVVVELIVPTDADDDDDDPSQQPPDGAR